MTTSSPGKSLGKSTARVDRAWRGVLTVGITLSLSLAGLSAAGTAEAAPSTANSQQSGDSLPSPTPTPSGSTADPVADEPSPHESPATDQSVPPRPPAQSPIPEGNATNGSLPAPASLATTEGTETPDPAPVVPGAKITVLDLSNASKPYDGIRVSGETTIDGTTYSIGSVTTNASGLATFFPDGLDRSLTVKFTVWRTDVDELSTFTLSLTPDTTATKTVKVRSKPATTKVTFTVIDENKWLLSGVQAQSNGYASSNESLYVSGKTSTKGKVTLTYKLYRDVSSLKVYLQDTYYVVADKTLTVKNLKAGETRDLGTVKLRANVTKGKASTAIKTSSKSAVNKAYKTRLAAKTKNEKPISPNGCKPKITPSAQQKRELSAVNFYRGMVGVQPVKLNSSLSKKATAAALIQYKNGGLNHYPSKTKKNCWTKTGYQASGSSNLALGVIGAAVISAYVEDYGAHNKGVGHRRWIMDPELTKVGTGSVGYANALYVTSPGSAKQAKPTWITWPSSGYFPIQEEPGGRWSFMSTRSDVNFSKAKVTVKVGNKKLSTSIISRDAAQTPTSGTMIMGHQWGLVFTVKKLPKVTGSKVVNVKVTISNLKLRNGTKLKDYTYTVKLFKAK